MTERPRVPDDAARLIIGTPPGDITLELLRSWLAGSRGGPPEFDARSAIAVPADLRRPPGGSPGPGAWGVRSAPGWPSVAETTVGRVIANGLIFSRSAELRAAAPYENVPWDRGVLGRVEQRLLDALLDGRISPEDLVWSIDRMQWLGYAPTSFLAPSMTIDTIRLPPRTLALKAAILAGPRGDAVRANDLKELGAVEDELLAAARAEVGGADPGMEIYDSGARGSYGNNYKNTAVMRGAIRKSDDPSSMTVSTASLADGIPMREMPAYADLMVQASYGRSMMTAQGGYIAKQLNAAFQGLAMDPDPASDCGTPLLLSVAVDDPRQYLYRFYRDGAGLSEVLPGTAASLRGRTVQMRSPMYCGSGSGICSRCAGTLFHRIGVTQIGLLASRVGTTLMNSALKAFHDTSLKMTRIDLSKYVREIGSPQNSTE